MFAELNVICLARGMICRFLNERGVTFIVYIVKKEITYINQAKRYGLRRPPAFHAALILQV